MANARFASTKRFLSAGLVCLLAGLQVPAQETLGAGDNDYEVGPEDVLSIQVWGRPELTGTATVDLAGRVRLNIIGEMHVAGRTPAQLSRDLTARYQLLDPSVADVLVAVEEYHSRSINIVGEVRSPDLFGFRDLPDLWGALLMAGGAAPKADLGRVQVIRDKPVPGEPRVLTVDLSRGVEETPVASLPELRPRDTILVPSTEEVAAGSDSFHVLGAVNSPGSYRMSQGKSVVEAISAAGGYQSDADLKHVYLTRLTGEGVESYEMNLKEYLQDGKQLPLLNLEPGDTITVPQARSFWSGIRGFLAVVLPFVSLAASLAITGNL